MQWEKYLLSPDGFCYLTEAHFKNTNTLPDQLCQIQTVCFHQMAAATWLRLTLRARLGVGGSEPVLKYLKNTNTNIEQIQILPDNIWQNSCCDLMAAATWLGSLWGRGSEAPSRYSSISPQGNSLHFCFAFLFISLPAGPAPCIYIPHNLSRNKHIVKLSLDHSSPLGLPGPSWPYFRVLRCHNQGIPERISQAWGHCQGIKDCCTRTITQEKELSIFWKGHSAEPRWEGLKSIYSKNG